LFGWSAYLKYLCIRKLHRCIYLLTFKAKSKMSVKSKPNWKRIIEFAIVILTTIASFIGGNVSAKNGYKLSTMVEYSVLK
jgi:hypothetical protein